jgi:4-hydroxyphenylpyruvate dioxygenase
VLGAAGLRAAGRHRSKAVTLWRQGSISLIVNARARFVRAAPLRRQRPSVLRDRPRRRRARARRHRAVALHSARFDGPRGPRELAMPGDRLARRQPVHFVAAAPASRPDRGRLRRRRWRRRDGGVRAATRRPRRARPRTTSSTPGCCSAAPCSGSSRARASSSPTRSAGPQRRRERPRAQRPRRPQHLDSQATRIARTASASGASPSSTSPSPATTSSTRSRGCARTASLRRDLGQLLRRPRARVDLDPALVATLRELGILFDRSPDGDYFHIYTEAFADRFFFEIVQRVGDYDAYGALNAPARLGVAGASRRALATPRGRAAGRRR